MIDLMGSVIPNDAEIEAEMQSRINATWPPAKREKVLRTGLLKAELDAFFAEMSATKAVIIADRDLLVSVIEYEQAEQRLAQPAVELIVDEGGAPTNQAEFDIYQAQAERDIAITTSASSDIVDLVALRKPVEVIDGSTTVIL